MVVIPFTVLAVIPIGVLYHFRIVPFLGDAALMSFVGQQLAHGRTDHCREIGKAGFIVLFGQPVEYVGKVEDEDVDMIVFHRDIAPAAGLQADVAQHLSRCKRDIPGVVP